MKKVFLAAMLAMVSMVNSNAKDNNVVWEHPATEYANTYYDGFFQTTIDVTQVEMNDKETIVYLTAHQRNDYPECAFQFVDKTYLKVGNERYGVIKADNFEFNKFLQTGKENTLDFAFHFPALPKGTKSFDLIEGDGDRAFQIKGIKPVEERWNQLLPSYWRDDTTGDWVIAFLDDCAIYDCKFWSYKQKPAITGDKTSFTISNGNEELQVTIDKNKKGKRTIHIGGKKQVLSMITSRFLPDYPKKDIRADFVNSGYKVDTATVVGWLKDLPEDQKGKKTFEISNNNIFTDNQTTVYADLDEQGRFIAKVPLVNSTEFFCDWGLCFIRTMLEPGKTYFMLYDFKEGRRMFMGDDCRLQNELFKFPLDWNEVRMPNGGNYNEYIPSVDSLLNARYTYIDNLCNEHPTLSTRFALYRNGNTLWRQANCFGQSRFSAPNYQFSDEARKYANDTFWTKLPEPLTLHREISGFLRDYLDDAERNSPNSFTWNVLYHIDEYALNEEELTFIKEWASAIKEIQAAIEAEPAMEKKVKMANEWNTKNADMIKKAEGILNNAQNTNMVRGKFLISRMNNAQHILDSLKASECVKDVWLTRLVNGEIEQKHTSLAPEVIDAFKAMVHNPNAIEIIEKQNNHYLAIENREFDKLVLKSNDCVNGISEGEALLKKIVEPYKGKIVLLDIWGTWCSPCKEALKHSQEEYAHLSNYDIEYLYLANNSPQESWENIIKEYNVSGDNVAHYNLPVDQQQAIERYLDIHSYPTWKLIDQNGNVLDFKVDARDLNSLEKMIKVLSSK